MELNQINLSLSSTGNIEKGRQQIKSMRDHYEAVRKALNAVGFTHQAHATNYWLTVCYDNNNTLYEIPVQMGLRPSDYVEILKAVNGDKTKLNLDVYPDVIFGESAQTSESSSGDVEAASTGLSADISAVHCSWYESHNSIFDDFELVTIQRGPRNISEMANSNQYDDSDVYSLIFLSVVQLTMMIVVLYLNVSIMGDKFGDSHYLHYCVIYPLVAIITGFTMVNKLDDVAENKLSLKMQQMNSGEEDSSSGVSGWVYLCIDWLDLLTFKVRFLLIELFKMFVSFFFALYASLLILLHYIRAKLSRLQCHPREVLKRKGNPGVNMFCSHYARAAMLCLLFANVSIAMVTSNVLNNLAHCIVLTFISELNVKLIDKFAGKMSVTTLMPRRLEDRVKHERFLRDNLMRWTFNRFTKYVILSMLMITLLRAFGTPPDAND